MTLKDSERRKILRQFVNNVPQIQLCVLNFGSLNMPIATLITHEDSSTHEYFHRKRQTAKINNWYITVLATNIPPVWKRYLEHTGSQMRDVDCFISGIARLRQLLDVSQHTSHALDNTTLISVFSCRQRSETDDISVAMSSLTYNKHIQTSHRLMNI